MSVSAYQFLLVSVSVRKLEDENYKNHLADDQFAKRLNYKNDQSHTMDADELDHLTPLEPGTIPSFNIENRKREDYIGYICSGFPDIPKDGIPPEALFHTFN